MEFRLGGPETIGKHVRHRDTTVATTEPVDEDRTRPVLIIIKLVNVNAKTEIRVLKGDCQTPFCSFQ